MARQPVKKIAILSTIDAHVSITLDDLRIRARTGQTTDQISSLLNQYTHAGLVVRNRASRRYSLTQKGQSFVNTYRWQASGKTETDPDLQQPPAESMPPTPAPGPAGDAVVPPFDRDLVDELKKLHGQLGRVIKCLQGVEP